MMMLIQKVFGKLEHLDYGHMNLESPARPVLDVTQDGTTDTDTDPSERLTLASHLDYGHMNLESPARPVLDVTQDGTTDTDTDPSEHSALASVLDYGFLHLDLPARPRVNVALDGRPIEGITDPLLFVVMALGSRFTKINRD